MRERGLPVCYLKTAFLVLLLLAGLAGCNSNSVVPGNTESVRKIKARLLGSIPLPSDARISNEGSLILGEGETWAGRIEIYTPQGPSETVAFFLEQYPQSGWTLISSTKARNSILVFVNPAKSATVEVTDGAVLSSGSRIIMTVAPRSTVAPEQKK